MKIAFCTLGCKVNHYESEVLRELFRGRAFETVPFGDPCDVCVIHSCAVTEESARKSRQMLRRARRICRDGAVVLMGCLAQTEPGTFPEADIVLGNKDKTRLPELVDAFFANRTPVEDVSPIRQYHSFEEMTLTSDERIRATVKIQDGCNNFCAYCVIPYARGSVRSKDISAAEEEARTLVEKGYPEIVLTGIHLDSYGSEHGRFSLYDLLDRLDRIPGLRRIRLGSTEPVMITPENVARMKSVKHLCPHFNLSLQSGCTETLRRMRRRYTAEEYAVYANRLREAFSRVGLTTDIIVGFPGETEEEFAKTLAFAERIGFSKINVFPFSPRRGTAAWDMPDPVPQAVKKERVRRLLALSDRLEASFRSGAVGQTVQVLFEREKDGRAFGFTPEFIPVEVKSNSSLVGRILPVHVTAADPVCTGSVIFE